MESGGLFCEDAGYGDDWKLKIKEKTGRPRFTSKIAINMVNVWEWAVIGRQV